MNYYEEIEKIKNSVRILLDHEDRLYLKTDEKELERIHIIRVNKLYKVLELLDE